MPTIENLKIQQNTSSEEQASYLCQCVADILQRAVDSRGQATLAVSGGSTPTLFFQQLSEKNLPWESITITLVDERWVASDHCDSNQQLVENHLLQNLAKKATFAPLYSSVRTASEHAEYLNQHTPVTLPIDVLMLGMGNDGHTASLFPCSTQLQAGLSTQDNYIAVEPTSAAHWRMSLSAECIEQAEHVFLQLKGQDKMATLRQACKADTSLEMPIQRFLTSELTIAWCP
ncbi:MAG: 6-phosphogluconolactonase [Pseudomonadales bacterium]